MKLNNPFMPGACPMADDLDVAKRLEDAGASVIVMRSLFEEQLDGLDPATPRQNPPMTGESGEFAANPDNFVFKPHEYLEHIRRLKESLDVPVIASLNGSTYGGWLRYAKEIEQSGADALELNVYYLATDPEQSGLSIEMLTLEMVGAVKRSLKIPIAVKLSPYYSSLAHFARQLGVFGADGMILFNRFYQPDIDVENLKVDPTIAFSDSSELPLRLRWLAILSGRVNCSLAASGGIHTGVDAAKAILAGADALQLVSALLMKGPEQLEMIRIELETWMDEHQYGSVTEMRGKMNLQRYPEPKAYERANYMRVLQSWKL
ncbi:dihydroorotate dehydrogenase-like protein [Candidatus Sumerlaeota bacterium]|nr:dihydroorotate dehydrogenase-like protein [Candidatus Sumerlaeota bacterium]